jgi:hypothetical protein
MRTILRGLRPSTALLIACLALFMAMGGVGYAALKGKEKAKVRSIADQEIAKRAPGLSVANAQKLGGAQAAEFQRFCSGGAVKATIVIDTTGVGPNFTNVPGFNCFKPGNLTSSVQIERIAQGQYYVRFVGNSGPNASGSAVVSSVNGDGLVTYNLAIPSPVPGETVFQVVVRNGAGNPVDNRTFSLLAF